MAVWEVAVREPAWTKNGITRVGVALLFFIAFPSSEEIQVPIPCWVNRKPGTHSLLGEQKSRVAIPCWVNEES